MPIFNSTPAGALIKGVAFLKPKSSNNKLPFKYISTGSALVSAEL